MFVDSCSFLFGMLPVLPPGTREKAGSAAVVRCHQSCKMHPREGGVSDRTLSGS